MNLTDRILKFLLHLLATAFVLFSFSSCSASGLQNLFTKRIELDYEKPADYQRLSKYQKDALYTTAMVKQSYPRLPTKVENFELLSQQFMAKVATIDHDFEFSVALRNFLAALKDGHSYHAMHYKGKTVFNIRLFKSGEEWVVANIDRTQDSSIIGSSVLSINGKDIGAVMRMVNRVESGENEYWRLKHFWFRISQPIYLECAGIIGAQENLSLEVSKNGKTRLVTLARDIAKKQYRVRRKKRKYPFAKKQNDGFYSYFDQEKNFAYLQMNTCLDYVAVKSEIDNYTNFFTRPIALGLMKKRKKNALNFGQFLQDYFTKVEQDSIQNIIIDLRNNTGGDERLGKQLIWYLTERAEIKGFTDFWHNSRFASKSMPVDAKAYDAAYFEKHGTSMPAGEINLTKEFYTNPYFYEIEKPDAAFELDTTISKFKGKVYVLIGEMTFSAAQILATTMYDNGIGTFVGTPTGNQPSCQTGFTMVKLPHTKKIVNLSLAYMERPDKSKNEEDALFPHVETPFTFMETYVHRIDNSIDYIMTEISKNKEDVQK
ncbi:MAG: S41 family peptidase [Saprospiraceae bacterium]